MYHRPMPEESTERYKGRETLLPRRDLQGKARQADIRKRRSRVSQKVRECLPRNFLEKKQLIETKTTTTCEFLILMIV